MKNKEVERVSIDTCSRGWAGMRKRELRRKMGSRGGGLFIKGEQQKRGEKSYSSETAGGNAI